MLGGIHVALGLQRDMAVAEHPLLARKRAKNPPPRRIGPPTRHGSAGNSILLEKGRKDARHVALGVSHVVLGLQRDMAAAELSLLARKRAKSRPPRRVGREPRCIGAPTRRGSAKNT